MQDRTRWTEEDISTRLAVVRHELLEFLRERTRLHWFEHKLRWRLSRRYVWPGAPDGLRALLDEKVAGDAGVEAFIKHVESRQVAISTAIEQYNVAVRRLMEQEAGVLASAFDEAHKQAYRERRISFQGTRDELLRRGRTLTHDSGPELIPELLSLRLAILTEDVRDEIFRDVSAILADEATLSPWFVANDRDLSLQERRWLTDTIELQLRCFDRCHAARLLAEHYAEARRLLDLDRLLGRYEALLANGRASAPSPLIARLLDDQRHALTHLVDFLEELFPKSASTHERERTSLRPLQEEGAPPS